MSDRGERRWVYGPVPSRRLGLSLGVDLIPFKVCPFDCVYCQVGRTTLKTTERREYAPAEEVIDQVRERLAVCGRPDYLTLAGSGEPTLHSRLGWIIDQLHGLGDFRVALITNGALFGDPAVRADAARADLVMPSLDAGDQARFAEVNRPCKGLDLAQVVDGLVAFRREYTGTFWLEVFLLAGVTASESHVQRIRELVDRIGPDRVLVNTAVRPTAEPSAKAVDAELLARLGAMFGPTAEVIADVGASASDSKRDDWRQVVLETLRRRPSRLRDIADALGLDADEAQSHLDALVGDGLVQPHFDDRGDFYEAADR